VVVESQTWQQENYNIMPPQQHQRQSLQITDVAEQWPHHHHLWLVGRAFGEGEALCQQKRLLDFCRLKRQFNL